MGHQLKVHCYRNKFFTWLPKASRWKSESKEPQNFSLFSPFVLSYGALVKTQTKKKDQALGNPRLIACEENCSNKLLFEETIALRMLS